MKKIKTKTESTKLDPNKYYSLEELKRMEAFSWCRSAWARRKVVERDAKKDNYLKAIVSYEGRGTKYKILGANIIKFIKAVESGKVRL